MKQGVNCINVLIIGRSGSGKSATTKLLTGNPAVKVANSLKQVTTEVIFYEGTKIFINQQQYQFNVMDIPGLDKIENRTAIRQKILETLQKRNISLHAIIYVSSLTQRDTLCKNKLFDFLEQLPWPKDMKRHSFIPIFTKFDNLVIDCQEEEITSIKQQYSQIFQNLGHKQAWSKRIYWINQTKSLQFKIKCYQDIREKYDKQLERFIEMIKRNKYTLTAKTIRQSIEHQNEFIISNLNKKMLSHSIPFKKEQKMHNIILSVLIEPRNMEESLTALSASSIGLFISKVCQKQLPMHFSALLMSIPLSMALLKMSSQSNIFYGLKEIQQTSGENLMKTDEKICKEINLELQRQWNSFNNKFEFKTNNKHLICTISKQQSFKFFEIGQLSLQIQEKQFSKTEDQDNFYFSMQIPTFKEQTYWKPSITIKYSFKKYEQDILLHEVEILCQKFWEKDS